MPQYAFPGLPATEPAEPRLIVSPSVLRETVIGLRTRSAGWRESACVWSGVRNPHAHLARATRVTFHHELADDRATALSLELPEAAKFMLYQRLASANETLLAMLHTHPRDWVDLSDVDAGNQLCSRVGFWSIVLPWYGRREWDVREIGFHERCTRGWRRLSVSEVQRRFVTEHQA